MAEVAERFSVSIDKLQDVNRINDPRTLMAGTYIKVPYHGQDLSRTSQDAEAARNVGVGGGSGLPVKRGALSTIELRMARRHIGELEWPVPRGKGRISSRFGWRGMSFHEGIDIAAQNGTPIYSAHAGRVVYSGQRLRGYGNLVVVKGEGILTVYGHNRVNRVRVGERISRGSRIAEVGESGKASGPHLHFETRVQTPAGKYAAVNPMVFFGAGG